MASLKQIYLDGQTALREGRLDEAAVLLEEVLRDAPDNLPVLLALMQAERLRARAAAAMGYLERAVTALAAGGTAPLVALIPAHEILHTAVSLAPEQVPAVYDRIRDLVRAGVAGIATPEKALRLSQIVFSIAESSGDAVLLHAYFEKCLPGFVGHELPLALSRATTLKERYGPSLRVLEPPHEVDIALGGYARRYPSPGFAAAVVPGGQMLCGWDFAVTAGGEVLSDTSYFVDPIVVGRWFPHRFSGDLGTCFHLWPEQVTDVNADAVFLSTPVNFAVGHWLCDILPRLRARDRAGIKVAVPANLPRKHRDLMALCGVAESEVIECELGGRYRFRNLVVALAGANTVAPPPGNVRFLASHLRAPDAKVEPGSRIFLQRAEKTRKVINQEELDGRLRALGFDFMDLAKTPIAEQRARLAKAETAVAVYGSDLLSCLFMPEGSRFISLDYRAEVDPFTGALDSAAAGIHSILLGIHFRVLDCAGSQQSGETIQRKDRDFTVDCGALERLIATL